MLIETSGNQRYIFATNKLRENVGASELTYQVGTRLVLEAVGKEEVCRKDMDGNNLRQFLLDEQQNPFTDEGGNKIEFIVATSGKSLLLVQSETKEKSKNKAEMIIGHVTGQALRQMPGLTVHGAICEIEDNLSDIHQAVGRVHRRLEENRFKIPSNEQRFLRLPFVEPCATSGLPASIYENSEIEPNPRSQLTINKRTASDAGRLRLEKS